MAGDALVPALGDGRAVEQGAADGHDAADDEPPDEEVDDGPGRVRLENAVCLKRNGQLVQHLRKVVNSDG